MVPLRHDESRFEGMDGSGFLLSGSTIEWMFPRILSILWNHVEPRSRLNDWLRLAKVNGGLEGLRVHNGGG